MNSGIQQATLVDANRSVVGTLNSSVNQTMCLIGEIGDSVQRSWHSTIDKFKCNKELYKGNNLCYSLLFIVLLIRLLLDVFVYCVGLGVKMPVSVCICVYCCYRMK